MAKRPADVGTAEPSAKPKRGRRPRTGSGEALSDRAYDHVRAAILNGAYRPNQRLPEDEVAAQLDISRTPVRVALMRLVDQGLVVRERQGWVVREHTPEEIREIYEVRYALEGMATGLTAIRATDDELAVIAAMYDGPLEAFTNRPRAELGRLNRDFHHAIVRAAGNRRLLEEWLRNRDFSVTYNMANVFTPDEMVVCIQGHWKIIEALRARDRDEAERLAREHVAEVQAAAMRRFELLGSVTGSL
ncbi:GntR family transcriptional regulator [Actinoallomurus acanthiterrae]